MKLKQHLGPISIPGTSSYDLNFGDIALLHLGFICLLPDTLLEMTVCREEPSDFPICRTQRIKYSGILREERH